MDVVWCRNLAASANCQWQPSASWIFDWVIDCYRTNDGLSNGWIAIICWLCASDLSCGSRCSVREILGCSTEFTRLWCHPATHSYLVWSGIHWPWLSGDWFLSVYVLVISKNFVWEPGRYLCSVWLWERAWIRKYPPARWSDCRCRPSKGTSLVLQLSKW